jgi:hypothetical protein
VELCERFGPANGNAQRVNSRKEEFTATNHGLVQLNSRDLTLVIKRTHSSAPECRSPLQVHYHPMNDADQTRGKIHPIRGGKDSSPPPEGPVRRIAAILAFQVAQRDQLDLCTAPTASFRSYAPLCCRPPFGGGPGRGTEMVFRSAHSGCPEGRAMSQSVSPTRPRSSLIPCS